MPAHTPPHPELPLDRVLEGPCADVLNTLPDQSVDMIFADPPYNLQLQKALLRPDMSRVNAVDDDWDHFESFEAYDLFTQEWLAACRRVLKDTGTLWVIGSYHNIYRVGAILMDLGYWILNDAVWVKTNPMPNFRGTRFTNAHETLIWAQKKRDAPYTFNYHAMKALNGDKQMRSDWLLPICSGQERLRVNGEKAHSTQKPEALLYRVILASSNPGDVILDPFFGTGTTGAVAKMLHRRWIGIERDGEYARLAQERIDAIDAPPYEAEVFTFKNPRRRPRVPFGALLERGLVQPGQTLYFNNRETITATVLASGHIRCGTLTGSIHQVGKALLGKPCNGWTAWTIDDGTHEERVTIDTLREIVRRELEDGQ